MLNFASTKPAQMRADGFKHRWNPEVEGTICKDSQWERTFSERYYL